MITDNAKFIATIAAAAAAGGAMALTMTSRQEIPAKVSTPPPPPAVDEPLAGKQVYLLAGDIGGTNTRLALFSTTGKDPVYVDYFRNLDYVNKFGSEAFHEILDKYLEQCFKEVSSLKESDLVIVACFACAGPISNNACEFTNIADGLFVIDGNDIAESTKKLRGCIKVAKIINDFVGQGYGALDLDFATETVELTENSKAMIDPFGPKICVGAGTGLGQCFMTISSHHPEFGYECFPSEGGHVEYAPRSDVEIELLRHLKTKFEQQHRVSVERVVSGIGLANVYEFLAGRFPEQVDKEAHQKFLEAGDMQGKVVSENAKKGNLFCQAMNIFASAYGSEVGSAGLKFIPTGGIYVSGGITAKLLEYNPEYLVGPQSPFMKAFHDKGRVAPLLSRVPLFAVKTEDLGLRGARVSAMRELTNYQSTLAGN